MGTSTPVVVVGATSCEAGSGTFFITNHDLGSPLTPHITLPSF